MYRFAVERGPGSALWLFALAAQLSGYNNIALALFIAGIAVFFLVAPAWHHARNWHLRRITLGPQAMGMPQVILLAGLAGTWVFLTLIIGAGAWIVLRPSPMPVPLIHETTGTVSSGDKVAAVTTSSDSGPLAWNATLIMEGGPPSGQNVFSFRFREVVPFSGTEWRLG